MVNQIKNLGRDSFLSLSVNILSTFIDFLLVLVLANVLGANEFGRYIFIISLIKFLGLPIWVGYPYFILRKSSYITSNKLKENNNLLWRNIFVILIYVIFLSLIILLFNYFSPDFLNQKANIILFGVISIIPALSLNNTISAIIRTSDSEIKGLVLEKLITNIIFIGFSLIFYWAFKSENHIIYLFLFSFSAILSLLFSLTQIKNIFLLTNLKTKNLINNVISEIRESILLVTFQIFVLFNSLLPIIILGFFESSYIVGNYKLALQISTISSLGLHSINKIVLPRYAKSFIKNDFLQIQKISINSNRLTIIYSFLISIFIFIFYKKFVTIFFGAEFLIPKITFMIILLTPFINSFFGSVGSIINMTGYEKVTFKWCGIELFIGLLCNIILIPKIGINGAAISSLIACLVRCFALWRNSLKLLKINSSFILNAILKFYGKKIF